MVNRAKGMPKRSQEYYFLIYHYRLFIVAAGTYTAEVSYWSPQSSWWWWSSISRPINKNSQFTRISLEDQCRTYTIGISDRSRKMRLNPQDSNQREKSSGVKWLLHRSRPDLYTWQATRLTGMNLGITKFMNDDGPRRPGDSSHKS